MIGRKLTIGKQEYPMIVLQNHLIGKRQPVIAERIPVNAKLSPVNAKHIPVNAQLMPVIVKRITVIEEHIPVVVEDNPVIAEHNPVVAERNHRHTECMPPLNPQNYCNYQVWLFHDSLASWKRCKKLERMR